MSRNRENFSFIRPTEEQALRGLVSSRSFHSVETTQVSGDFDPASIKADRNDRRRVLRIIEKQRLGLLESYGEPARELPEFVGLTRRLKELQRAQHANRRFLTSPDGRMVGGYTKLGL